MTNTSATIVRAPVRVTLLLCVALIHGLFLTAPTSVRAQPSLPTFKSLHTNIGNPSLEDRVLVQGSDGNIYGTTPYGGPNDTGTLYRMVPGGTPITLYSFSKADTRGTNADGALPNGLIQGIDGNFYGTTYTGGTTGNGTVFKWTAGGVITVLHTFAKSHTNNSNPDGSGPRSLIQGNDGTLYGTTNAGGSSGNGIVFKLTTTGNFTTIYTFPYYAGSEPSRGLLQGADGSLYIFGKYGFGILNKVNVDGSGFTLIYGSSQKGHLTSLTVGQDGNLYGTSAGTSSTDGGNVLKLTPSGTATTLYTFVNPNPSSVNSSSVNSNGYNPNTLVSGGDGNLYGTTYNGGANGSGTLFKITTGGTLTTLYSFTSSTGLRNVDGVSPTALIQGSDGNLYGATEYGGALGLGELFQSKVDGTMTSLASCTSPLYEGSETVSLIQGKDGNFYGLTGIKRGDGVRPGTVFKMTPSGAITTLYAFSPVGTIAVNGVNLGNADGDNLWQLAQGTDGNLYGIANAGGIYEDGTAFKLTLDGRFSVLHSFNNNSPLTGFEPDSLVAGADGNLYGTMIYGGTDYTGGSVFQMTPSGTVTPLHFFDSRDSIGNYPTTLVPGIDGNFYGVTGLVQSFTGGSVFSVTAGGGFSAVADFYTTRFPGIPNYVYLRPDQVVQGRDGNLYGTVTGDNNLGPYIYKVLPSGTGFTVIKEFTNAFPYYTLSPSFLTAGSDGNIYCAVKGDPVYSQTHYGALAKLAPDGTFTYLHHFSSAGGDGAYPTALLEGADGNLYGTTSSAATASQTNNHGSIFEVTGGPVQLTDLGTLGGPSSRAYGLNEAGQVVGASQTINGDTHAFLWNPPSSTAATGTMTDLDTLGGIESAACSINNNAQIVGYGYDANQNSHPFLYSNGTMMDTGTLGGSEGGAYGINDNGEVVGAAFNLSDNSHASIEDSIGLSMIDLDGSLRGYPRLSGGFYSAALGVSQNGTIVGEVDTTSGMTHAFRSSGGTVQDLGTLPGGSGSTATAVDDNGYAVGAGDVATGDTHGCLWEDSGLTDLGTLPSVTSGYSFASAQNSQEVVGTSYVNSGSGPTGYHAFVWNGSMADLNDFVPPGSGWILEGATGVNQSGQIVGYGLIGGAEHAYLLSPFPGSLINPH